MAGAFVEINVDSKQVTEALQELLHKTGNLEPAFREIGEYLDRSHRERFDKAVDPEGKPWAPLSPVTIARKKHPGKILVESGDLRDLLHAVIRSDSMDFGTNMPYGAAQQFGAEKGSFGTTKRGGPIPWGDIPAREFIGISSEDEREVLDIVHDYLAE